MLIFSIIVSCVAAALALAAFLTALAAFGRTSECLRAKEDIAQVGADLTPLKERLDGLDDRVIRSVMEEGGDASVEAVLQTAQRLIDMDPDESTTLAEALLQSRQMHKR